MEVQIIDPPGRAAAAWACMAGEPVRDGDARGTREAAHPDDLGELPVTEDLLRRLRESGGL